MKARPEYTISNWLPAAAKCALKASQISEGLSIKQSLHEIEGGKDPQDLFLFKCTAFQNLDEGSKGARD